MHEPCTKQETIKSIFEVENIQEKLSLYKYKKPEYIVLLNTISQDKYDLQRSLGLCDATINKLIKYLWPEKNSWNRKICTHLLLKYELKYCTNCKLVKEISLFSANASKSSGLNNICKACYTETTREYQREYQRTRDARQDNQCPSWADISKIREIYKKCPKGYHVDHIVPLKGVLVSGLHVENNLQYLTAEENIRKRNKFEIT